MHGPRGLAGGQLPSLRPGQHVEGDLVENLLSERGLEPGIEYFTAEVLAEDRTMLALLAALRRVETESRGPVVAARLEIAGPPRHAGQDLLTAAARGDVVGIPVLRRLIHVPDGLAHIVRLPVAAVLKTLRPRVPGQLTSCCPPKGPPLAGAAGDRAVEQ
jgi:hypothetical protein